jgi:hypothetical protein
LYIWGILITDKNNIMKDLVLNPAFISLVVVVAVVAVAVAKGIVNGADHAINR